MSSIKILGETYTINGRSAEVSGLIPDMSADIYYEVVRLIDGKFLFLDDHLERLEHSLAGAGILFPGKDEIKDNLRLLLKSNSLSQGNIRICLQSSIQNGVHLLCYFIPYFYPSDSMYLEGVDLHTYPHIRPTPGIKKWDNAFRTSVNSYIRDKGIYEAVLLNSVNQITEGSRSNIFFIDTEEQLITPPEQLILPGITRKYVLAIAKSHNITVREELVSLDSLNTYVSAFISGTSPKVLPVKRLDNYRFEVANTLLQTLRDQFELLIKDRLSTV